MIKHCPHCGKELPPESNFCPYCMTKLIQEEKVSEKPPQKPKQKKWIIYIGIAAGVLIVAVILWAILRQPAKKNIPAAASAVSAVSSRAVPSSESVSSETSDVSSSVNYDSYVGKWYDEASQNKSDIMTQGGDCLQIVSANSTQMVFSLTAVTKPPTNRIAKIDNVTGQVNGNTISFAFSDDGWGNAGKGTLKLKDGEIYAKVEITEPDSSAQMSLSMQCYFKKVQETSSSQSSAPLDVSQIIEDYSGIRGKLGEETAKSYIDKDTGYEIHTYGAVTVSIDSAHNDTVMNFLIDYTKIKDKKQYCFDALDGNATYKDVTDKYGTSSNESPNNIGKEVGYEYRNGYYVKFIFNKSNNITSIYCFNKSSEE